MSVAGWLLVVVDQFAIIKIIIVIEYQLLQCPNCNLSCVLINILLIEFIFGNMKVETQHH